MPRFRHGLFTVLAFALVALAALSAPAAHGQAGPAASRSLGFSAFGGYEYVHPDYGPKIANNNGYLFGIDATRFFGRRPFAASLEARVNINHGHTVNEKTYVVGGKFEYAFHQRYHPYADFLVGVGTIHFNVFPPFVGYIGDNGPVESYGGGGDIDLSHSFAAKVDYQFSHWSLGKDYPLTPGLFSVGIKYNLPFRGRITR